MLRTLAFGLVSAFVFGTLLVLLFSWQGQMESSIDVDPPNSQEVITQPEASYRLISPEQARDLYAWNANGLY
jgi:hypothetical protein